MKFSRIDHVALEVADLQHSVDFYSKHFGFRHYFDQTTPAGLKVVVPQIALPEGSATTVTIETSGQSRFSSSGWRPAFMAETMRPTSRVTAPCRNDTMPLRMAGEMRAVSKFRWAFWRTERRRMRITKD